MQNTNSPLERNFDTADDLGGGGMIGPDLIFTTLRHWWKWTVPLGIVLAIVAAAVVMQLFEPMYRSTAWLRIESRAPYLAFPQSVGTYKDPFVETQLELIRSPLVLGDAVGNAEVAQLPEIAREAAPLDYLSEKVTAELVGDSELVQIAYDGPNPHDAAVIVNAVLQSYLLVHSDDEIQRSGRIIELLEEERARRARQLENLRGELRDLTAAAGGSLSSLQQTGSVVAPNPLASLEERLTAAEVERHLLQVQVQALEENAGKPDRAPAAAEISAALEADPQVQQMHLKINERRGVLAAIAAVSARSDRDPQILHLEQEIKQLTNSLEELQGRIRPAVIERLKHLSGQQREEQLAQLKLQLQNQKLLEDLLRKQIDERRSEMSQLADRSLDVEFARSEVIRAEEVFKRISDRSIELRTELRAPARVALIQKAVVPSKPLEPIPWKKLAAACLFALCMPMGLAFLWEFKEARISVPDQISRQSQLPVLGEITVLPQKPQSGSGRALQSFDQQIRTFGESVDYVRTNLQLETAGSDCQVLVVASAVSGEGKTSLAAYLANSLAQSYPGETLLMDADLRHPDVHRMFEVSNELGVAEVLAGAPATDAIIADGHPQLHLLPAGRPRCSPTLLLGKGNFDRVLGDLRKQYRYIVIDVPPVLPVSDALLVARAADHTLLAVMRDKSREPQVRLAQQRLTSAGAHLLGAVFNGVSPQQYSERYGTYEYTLDAMADSTA